MRVKTEQQLCPGPEHQGSFMAALNAASLCTAVFAGHFCQRLNCPVTSGVVWVELPCEVMACTIWTLPEKATPHQRIWSV